MFQELQVQKFERKPGNFLCTSEQNLRTIDTIKLNEARQLPLHFRTIFHWLQVPKFFERKPGNFLCTSEQIPSKNYKYKKLNGSQATSSALPNNIPKNYKYKNWTEARQLPLHFWTKNLHLPMHFLTIWGWMFRILFPILSIDRNLPLINTNYSP